MILKCRKKYGSGNGCKSKIANIVVTSVEPLCSMYGIHGTPRPKISVHWLSATFNRPTHGPMV